MHKRATFISLVLLRHGVCADVRQVIQTMIWGPTTIRTILTSKDHTPDVIEQLLAWKPDCIVSIDIPNMLQGRSHEDVSFFDAFDTSALSAVLRRRFQHLLAACRSGLCPMKTLRRTDPPREVLNKLRTVYQMLSIVRVLCPPEQWPHVWNDPHVAKWVRKMELHPFNVMHNMTQDQPDTKPSIVFVRSVLRTYKRGVLDSAYRRAASTWLQSERFFEHGHLGFREFSSVPDVPPQLIPHTSPPCDGFPIKDYIRRAYPDTLWTYDVIGWQAAIESVMRTLLKKVRKFDDGDGYSFHDQALDFFKRFIDTYIVDDTRWTEHASVFLPRLQQVLPRLAHVLGLAHHVNLSPSRYLEDNAYDRWSGLSELDSKLEDEDPVYEYFAVASKRQRVA